MKKLLVLCLTLVMLMCLSSCKSETPETIESEPQILVFIDDGNGGAYSLMSKGSVTCDGDNFYDIVLDDPTLLAFKVSESQYPGGVGMLSGEDISAKINSIEEFMKTNELDAQTELFLEQLLEWLSSIPVVEGAST